MSVHTWDTEDMSQSSSWCLSVFLRTFPRWVQNGSWPAGRAADERRLAWAGNYGNDLQPAPSGPHGSSQTRRFIQTGSRSQQTARRDGERAADHFWFSVPEVISELSQSFWSIQKKTTVSLWCVQLMLQSLIYTRAARSSLNKTLMILFFHYSIFVIAVFLRFLVVFFNDHSSFNFRWRRSRRRYFCHSFVDNLTPNVW